jgi:hypothetical protein
MLAPVLSWDNVLGQRTPMSTQGALETQRGASFDMYLIDDAPLSHRGENVSETGFNVLIYNLRFPDARLRRTSRAPQNREPNAARKPPDLRRRDQTRCALTDRTGTAKESARRRPHTPGHARARLAKPLKTPSPVYACYTHALAPSRNRDSGRCTLCGAAARECSTGQDVLRWAGSRRAPRNLTAA